MLTYQVKIEVKESIEQEWLNWMKTEHVPEVIATGLVKSFNILKSTSADQVYLFQYHFGSEEDLNAYQTNFAPSLKEHPLKKFPNQFTAQREILKWL